jgi:hypothetical protein
MLKRASAPSRLILLLFMTLAVSAWAAQRIKIEIVKLTWVEESGHIASFHAQAILPDGSHSMLICRADEKGCAGFQSFALENSGCDREHMVVTCSATDLGFFPVRRAGNYIVLYVPHGTRKYRIVGSW